MHFVDLSPTRRVSARLKSDFCGDVSSVKLPLPSAHSRASAPVHIQKLDRGGEPDPGRPGPDLLGVSDRDMSWTGQERGGRGPGSELRADPRSSVGAVRLLETSWEHPIIQRGGGDLCSGVPPEVIPAGSEESSADRFSSARVRMTDGACACVRACRDGDLERVTISGAGAHLAGRDLPHGPDEAVFGHMAPILISVCFTTCVCVRAVTGGAGVDVKERAGRGALLRVGPIHQRRRVLHPVSARRGRPAEVRRHPDPVRPVFGQ